MEDRCICCGEIIPEGRQICINCENNDELRRDEMDEKKVREEEYLEFPWGIEDTIENLRELKSILQQQVRGANCDGKGAQDAFEVGFDFDRAIEALEKQLPKKAKENEIRGGWLGKQKHYTCPTCGNCLLKEMMNERQNTNCCWDCGQKIDWSE